MRIYHYTTIENLALIIKHKTIRFNRLDKVDDCEESIYGSGDTDTKLGLYQFVSCWTKASQENLALWKMYTNYCGVRIGLDEDMFVTYPLSMASESMINKDSQDSLAKNHPFRSYFRSFMEIHEDYMVSLVSNEAKLHDVKYVDDPQSEIKKLIKNDGNGMFSINTKDASLFKRKEWSVQSESRFKISVWPLDENFVQTSKNNSLFDYMSAHLDALDPSLKSNKPIKTEYIDISLKVDALQNIDVMMGPMTSEGERFIVESLLKEFPTAKISDSYFKGKIRKK